MVGVWNFHIEECTAIAEYMQLPSQYYIVIIVRESESRMQSVIVSYVTDSTKGVNANQINE